MFDIAYAATASGTASGAGMGSTIMMIVLMIAIFYFLMIRPENKRKKQAEEMRSALKKGDWLTTIGGVYGRVVAITDRTVVIETSEDRVRVEFLKSAIGQVGTLDQQAAAQQRPAKKDKKAAEEKVEKVEEKPAETETKSESDKTDAQ
jgi:preprotein translocase subunit YajC